MNNQQKRHLASISAVQCLRGFLAVRPFIANAVHTAFKIDWIKGARDDALYWKKQADVLSRMSQQATSALEFVSAGDPYPLVPSTGSFAHLASPHTYRMAFDAAQNCLDDIVTHYGDFVKALQMEADFFLPHEVQLTLAHEKPNTIVTANAVNDLKNLAEAVLAAMQPDVVPAQEPAA